jgi:hypothetical protein
MVKDKKISATAGNQTSGRPSHKQSISLQAELS